MWLSMPHDLESEPSLFENGNYESESDDEDSDALARPHRRPRAKAWSFARRWRPPEAFDPPKAAKAVLGRALDPRSTWPASIISSAGSSNCRRSVDLWKTDKGFVAEIEKRLGTLAGRAQGPLVSDAPSNPYEGGRRAIGLVPILDLSCRMDIRDRPPSSQL